MNAMTLDANRSETERAIRAFVEENFVLTRGAQAIGAEDSLTQLGLIDSTGVLELITFLEQSFDITVRDEETTPDNLDTVTRIVAFVERKRAGE